MQENVEGEADLVTADSHYWWERWLGPGNLDALMGPRVESSSKSWLSAQQSCLAFRDSLLPRDSRAWGAYGVTQLELCCFIYVCTVAWKRLWGCPSPWGTLCMQSFAHCSRGARAGCSLLRCCRAASALLRPARARIHRGRATFQKRL